MLCSSEPNRARAFRAFPEAYSLQSKYVEERRISCNYFYRVVNLVWEIDYWGIVLENECSWRKYSFLKQKLSHSRESGKTVDCSTPFMVRLYFWYIIVIPRKVASILWQNFKKIRVLLISLDFHSVGYLSETEILFCSSWKILATHFFFTSQQFWKHQSFISQH